MTPNNNLNPLPFYTDIEKQNHRKSYAYNKVYPLICKNRLILPFQVVRAHAALTPITAFVLINFETGAEHNITTEMLDANLIIKEFADFDLIINYGRFLLPSEFDFRGLFYVRMTDGITIWYSDVFNFIQDLSKCVKVVWYNRNDIFEYTGAYIDYNDGYQNYCYVISEVGKPKYPFEEEIFERDGFTFPEKQISEKVYLFEFMSPEYLLDAMRIIRMHDYIFVESKGDLYDVEQFLLDSDWEDQGDLATAEVEFHTDTIMKKIGKGISALYAGDYNDDFNDDYSGGEEGEGEAYSHTFWTMTGSIVVGVGFFVEDCHINIKIKSTSEEIVDQDISGYQFFKADFVAGIVYEITISRDGYYDLVFDFEDGTPAGTTNLLLIENPATIYYSKSTGGYDLVGEAIIPNVTITGKAENNNNIVINENSGGSGTVSIQFKKGLRYTLTYAKSGFNNANLEVTESTNSPFYAGMTPT